MSDFVVNALSIDLEDWYHICGLEHLEKLDKCSDSNDRLGKNVENILFLLKQYDIHATFFVVGSIAKDVPGLIKRIADAGHELAAHGFSHHRIFDMTPEEFEEDLLRTKVAIEDAIGKKISGYRAPEWSLKKTNVWALDILKKHGFSYDASAVPLSHLGGKYFNFYPYEIKTKYGNIFEFPLSTFRCLWDRLPFSGGLPMRITPYFFIFDCTKMINNLGYPVIFYLHPWEFDSDQVKINLPINRHFMRYCNLESTEKKTRLLLEHFEFTTVEEVFGLSKANRRKSSFRSKDYKCYDVAYFKSVVLTAILIMGIFVIIFGLVFLMKQYAFLLVIIMLTIFYWPWGLLFNKGNLFAKCGAIK
ncbi:MAG: hypothetical protein COX96_06760 [Candidatus Omnitrophica bacterium CG_4_10_14_0_2_um_filter_44_9]|nr:MAG: hypothetical protein AUJ70_04045 [Candidatus Omnitrophica bacterium CG1_02_40_15]PIY81974.1 MAG: hypothetical protein COY78_09245 [Candidatus Omnitrophica bacterium CG_4_10_14_0_8_um_filter_44_12]PIZ83804.1 MAG: hypothetical protein COX96_06760 [Candidatus Omnitrophica bacterium CG_4_10_14_0_2_um_filter_44_9]